MMLRKLFDTKNKQQLKEHKLKILTMAVNNCKLYDNGIDIDKLINKLKHDKNIFNKNN